MIVGGKTSEAGVSFFEKNLEAGFGKAACRRKGEGEECEGLKRKSEEDCSGSGRKKGVRRYDDSRAANVGACQGRP